MLSESRLPMYFWAEAVNTACYTQNRILINKYLMKTPYEIMNDKKPTLKYFHVFGAMCFVLKDGDDRRGKFEAKAHETVFVGYSKRSYRVYIIGQHQVKESVNITFDYTKLPNVQIEDASEKLKFNNLSNPDSDDEDTQHEIVADDNNVNHDGDHGEGGGNIDFNRESTDTGEESSRNVGNNSGGDVEGSSGHSQHQNVFQGESLRSIPPIRSVWSRDHPFELIIGDPDVGVRTRSATQNKMYVLCVPL